MNKSKSFGKPDKNAKVPETPKARINELMKLPLADKEHFIPPCEEVFRIGPFIYAVVVTNPGKLRFTATLVDVVIKDVPDGETVVGNPARILRKGD